MEAPVVEEQPSRTTILGSFLRGRPRNTSQSHIHVNTEQQQREVSPLPQPPSPNPTAGRRRNQIVSTLVQQPASSSSNTGLAFSNMLRRRRSAGNVNVPGSAQAGPGTTAPPQPIPVANSTTAPAAASSTTTTPGPSHRIRLVPHLDNRRNLRFEAITRDLREGDPALRIGRFTDRSGLGLAAANAMNTNKLAFKSKVVSRAHAEIWVDAGGKFYIKDTKSSSGTFLNHVRLSPANSESKPFHIKDGDIIQLGVDYQGGTEDIYKSVKIRLELGREWQSTANAFNTNAIKNLKALAGTIAAKSAPGGKAVKTQLGDCCICLFPVTIRQSLFITPCSHTFHYKCIRPLLESHHPGFCCPLCRTFADLEEDVEVDAPELDLDMDDSPAGSGDDEGHLGPPIRETGAETEVEGEAGAGPSGRPRTLGRGSTPLTDDLVEEEQDEDMVLVDRDIPGVDGPRSTSAMDVDGDVAILSVEDVDGTVGGKRKR